jgi:murein DD-endopeptidase MepM/ murein hydrolase activator NlpD
VRRRLVAVLALWLLVGATAPAAIAYPTNPPSSPSALDVVVHVVQSGETVFSIADLHGATVDAIVHANGIRDPRRVYVGQRLVIPSSARLAEGRTASYVVQAGDTLTSIARRYETTWTALVELNDLLSPSALYAGQVIDVPASAAGEEGELVEGRAGGRAIYMVRPGETLLHIAFQYNISPLTLAAISRIGSPSLVYEGQELAVPGEGQSDLPEPFQAVRIQPLPVAQGSVLAIVVETGEPVELEGWLFGQAVEFADEGGTYYALTGVYALAEPGMYELELTAVSGDGWRTGLTAGIIVEAGGFGYERIALSESTSALLAPELVAAERERLAEVRYLFTPERYWTAPFIRPCEGAISSYFGSRRAYNAGPYTSYHAGVDFRATTGVPVYAAAAGVVTLAEPLTVRGNAIVINHGWGVSTGYWHLSVIEVRIGDLVAPGDLIGRVGSTGLSTGAHLHWEVWVAGVSVNGLEWLDASSPWLAPLLAEPTG